MPAQNPLDRLLQLREDLLARIGQATPHPGPSRLDPDDMNAVIQALAERHAEEVARNPKPPPGSPLPDLMNDSSRYDLARRIVEQRTERLRRLERAAEDVSQELLPPLVSAGPGEPEDKDLETLRSLQRQLLRHPIAFRSAFVALVAEGRRFAATPEGAAWAERLRDSPLLPDIRLLLKMVSLSMLDEEDPEVLPSAYLDAILRVAASDDTDTVLNRLFGGGAHVGNPE